MTFKSLLVALLLPPTSLVPLTIIGLLIRSRYARTGRIVTWAPLLALLALSLPIVSDPLLIALERGLPLAPPADAPPQAIVILGGDVLRSTQDGQTAFRIGALSLERVRAGAILQRQTGLPILVTGGPLHSGDPSVAMLMAFSLMRDFGVPVRWIESESRDTWENAQMSAEILHQAGISSVFVVTQAWHMQRALQSFADTGIHVTASPTHLDQPVRPVLSDFLPNVSAWLTSYFALHEWIGRAWYAL
jgi:uncharacterized SAM-binding protein YcdF (DUF218 family)